MKDSKWTFFVVVIVGLWLLVTPSTFGYQNKPLIISNWITGALLILFGLNGRRHHFLIWPIAILGIWLQFNPLAFWARESAAYLNDTFVGSILIVYSLLLYPPSKFADTEPSIPRGWSYNPSSWPGRLVIAFLAFICWMTSRYLAAYQLGYIDAIWEPFFMRGTIAVLESKISKAFPVPDAGLGAFAYTLEFFSTCLGGKARWRTMPWAVMIFGILVIPVSLVSVILIILQPLAVGTWCTLCLITAICMLIAIPFAVGEVAATLQFLRKNGVNKLFTGGLSAGAKKDTKIFKFDASFSTLWQSARSGVSVPWNLALATIIGILLMIAPSIFHLSKIAAGSDPIAGALTIVVSVISCSDILRRAAHLIALFGIWILIQLFWLDSTTTAFIYHALAAVLLIALSFRTHFE